MRGTFADSQPVAVVFHLVEPIVPIEDRHRAGGEAGLEHATKMKIDAA